MNRITSSSYAVHHEHALLCHKKASQRKEKAKKRQEEGKKTREDKDKGQVIEDKTVKMKAKRKGVTETKEKEEEEEHSVAAGRPTGRTRGPTKDNWGREGKRKESKEHKIRKEIRTIKLDGSQEIEAIQHEIREAFRAKEW